MRFTSWREARAAAAALFSWLGGHCPSCGKRHTKVCLDGGRCVQCGRSLGTVATLAEAVAESDSRLFPKAAAPKRDVVDLIADKACGKDCTAEESAEIKAVLGDIRRLFPNEWDEVVS